MAQFTSRYAVEAIAFQSTAFFNSLTLVCEGIKEQIKEDKKNSGAILEEGELSLQSVVKEFTNMTLLFSVDQYAPCVEIPLVNRNHPLLSQLAQQWLTSDDGLKMLKTSDDYLRGSVSLKTGKVSGIFATISTTIHLPRDMFLGKFMGSEYTCEEIAAIILHEIGHIGTYFEFMAMSVTTNQVLAGVAKALDKSGTVDERETILMTVKDRMNLKDLDAKTLAKNTNKRVIEIAVITNIINNARSELGTNLCDLNSCEMLADQFAARFGAGRDLQTALVKMHKSMGDIAFRSSFGYIVMEIIKMFQFLCVMVAGTLGGPAGLLAAYVLSLYLIGIIVKDSSGNNTYDRPGARMLRTRHQIVENLKDENLSKEDIERLNDDIKTIDECLLQIKDRQQLVGIIWDFFSPGSRKFNNQMKLQQELEALAANDLFVKASEFRAL